MNKKIAIIGIGNVGWHFAKCFSSNNDLVYAWDIKKNNTEEIVKKFNCKILDDLSDVPVDIDLCILSVSDEAIADVCSKMPKIDGIIVHTSGSINMNILENFTNKYGVLYPLQTFQKNKELDYKKIPLFIEANNNENLKIIDIICQVPFGKIICLGSEARKHLHLSAVFACNFVNASLICAEEIAKENNIDFNNFIPLIEETTRKIKKSSPSKNQTGPAVRKNEKIINLHIKMLKKQPLIQLIYKNMSNYIKSKY